MNVEQYISIVKDLIDHFLATSDTISDSEKMLYALREHNSNFTNA